MSSRRMSLLPRATLHSDSEQLLFCYCQDHKCLYFPIFAILSKSENCGVILGWILTLTLVFFPIPNNGTDLNLYMRGNFSVEPANWKLGEVVWWKKNEKNISYLLVSFIHILSSFLTGGIIYSKYSATLQVLAWM